MVRAADPQLDAAACAAIYASYVRGAAASFEDEPPDAVAMGARIAATSVTHPWLVAEREGRVVGYAYGCPHRERAAYRWASDVSVYVDRAHHRAGVGRALYAALLELLRRQRLFVACAGITLPNPASVALHESFGFVAVGVYRNIGWKAGEWRDVGWWQLELRAPVPGPPAEPLRPQDLAASGRDD
ncbi:MAG: N-acetyltransferase family protein [Actinomycetota bacterium]|nr:N-acetyltransferase family protein [Actinomycetota bacterium]